MIINRKNIIYSLLAIWMSSIIPFGCTKVKPVDVDNHPQARLLERDMKKWAEERQLQKEQNESDAAFRERVKAMYEAYYKALREYKESDHRIVYGWFSGWAATEGVDRSFLCNLPDSVDIVALWGGTNEFDEKDPRWEDLRIAQEVKGLKVVLCWQTGASGLGLPGGVPEFNKRHQGKSSVEKAQAYAEELTAFIKKHNLNGYDIDWEPHVGNHGYGSGNNLYNNDTDPSHNDEPIRTFITEMGKNFGPRQTTDYKPRGTKTVFLFDGEIRDMSVRFGDLGDYFDYYINQNYGSVYGPNHEMTNVAAIKDFTWKKYVQADEFEKWGTNGGSPHFSNPSLAERKANQAKIRGYGGWAAYHIELDPKYKWTRRVIRIMNPSSVFNPDDNKDNQFLENN